MRYNVAGLLKEEVGASRRYAIEPEEPIHRGRIELIRVPRGILVRCDAEVLIEAQCSRCLVPFAYPQELVFEEIYRQQVDLVDGRRIEPIEGEDEDQFLIGLENEIDISEAVRQYTEMAAAMQPLCRPDCPGLCPECGMDLSIESCQCERTPIDPRWAKLFALQLRNHG
ncbi:DUF177 domain-containing protein [Tepidiforma sp.]|uniref:YceD family protein n=1 Tax=Tepidiforma sp. TaxID=2682230 RepID=UPI002ADD61CC|nr:DUF177 domain-containing protein [Tepidiforma sp.]